MVSVFAGSGPLLLTWPDRSAFRDAAIGFLERHAYIPVFRRAEP